MANITIAKKKAAEVEIRKRQQEVKYDLRDFTVDYLVGQFGEDAFYIPDYQRAYIWDSKRKSRFIESILLGLPIPMMFVAEMEDGRLEIVDGAQRIQTLEAFIGKEMVLKGLERLPSLNGFGYDDLPSSDQRKFRNKALRIVVLEETTSMETRKEIFDRVNTSGLKAKPSEIRRGSLSGPLMTFVEKCGDDPLFRELCPLTHGLRQRREPEELVLRFFAYSERYLDFRHDVEHFLTNFVKDYQKEFPKQRFKEEFHRMLNFVGKYFPYGFAKSPTAKSTPRVRFEAISVGVNLALRIQPNLTPPPVHTWLESAAFASHVTTHASNSRPRLQGRVGFVRDHLLGKE